MRYLAAMIAIVALGLAACEAPPTGIGAEAEALLSRSSETCDNLSGTITAAFVAGEDWDIEGTLFDEQGAPLGDAFAWIDDAEPRGDGSLHLDMRHRYVIDGSDLVTEDRGVLSPIDPPLLRFNNRLEVVGGSGAFSAATGVIRAHGTVDMGSAEIRLAYHGRVCR
jgi:hypothetical protein